MKTKLVNLVGDPHENFYQLGLKEKEAFARLDNRVTRLLSTNLLARMRNDFLIKLSVKLKKNEDSLFRRCLESYAKGLGIDANRYLAFISVFEMAAYYGNTFPELKGLLPGCTSVFQKLEGEVHHGRLLDFPLIGDFEESPRLYHWKLDGLPVMLSYSCEGLAPLLLQTLHESGISFALHHKPGTAYYKEGKSIFEIAFDVLTSAKSVADMKREVKKKASLIKWGMLFCDHQGKVVSMDIDGPNLDVENYDLSESSPLIFTNLALKPGPGTPAAHLTFCQDRQSWLKQKMSKAGELHLLDILTDVKDQRTKKWLHPAATLSTVGAVMLNLGRGQLDVKEGSGALVASDAILRFDLGGDAPPKTLRPKTQEDRFEEAWKRASRAQSAFDQGDLDGAYHQLQMSIAMMPHSVWKEILNFYLCLWDFRFVGNHRELSLIYKRVKKLKVPPALKDQWLLLNMRLEKQLQLMLTVDAEEVSPHLRNLFEQEKQASRPLFNTWMKSLYPRMELLDVFSPHYK
jgi:hypothetical protein